MNEERTDDFATLLRQALLESPPAEPPPGFARATANLVTPARESATMEILATRLLLGLAVFATSVSVVMAFPMIAERIGPLVRDAPWPLLLTAAAAFGVIGLTERLSRS
jgi:hypothetical protein